MMDTTLDALMAQWDRWYRLYRAGAITADELVDKSNQTHAALGMDPLNRKAFLDSLAKTDRIYLQGRGAEK